MGALISAPVETDNRAFISGSPASGFTPRKGSWPVLVADEHGSGREAPDI